MFSGLPLLASSLQLLTHNFLLTMLGVRVSLKGNSTLTPRTGNVRNNRRLDQPEDRVGLDLNQPEDRVGLDPVDTLVEVRHNPSINKFYTLILFFSPFLT